MADLGTSCRYKLCQNDLRFTFYLAYMCKFTSCEEVIALCIYVSKIVDGGCEGGSKHSHAVVNSLKVSKDSAVQFLDHFVNSTYLLSPKFILQFEYSAAREVSCDPHDTPLEM